MIKVHILRGKTLESEHIVDACVMHLNNNTVSGFGDTQRVVFPRSCIKPVQTLVLAASDLQLDSQRLALASSSHWAQPLHVQLVKQWLTELGLREASLCCGPHYPMDRIEEKKMIRENVEPSAVHNNCSGKHLGFLHVCKKLNYQDLRYYEWSHPLQAELRKLYSDLLKVDFNQRKWSIDGCGIPTYEMTLLEIAKMMSLFLQKEHRLYPLTEKIWSACVQHPDCFGGDRSLVTEVMKVAGSDVLIKNGAEGVYFFASKKHEIVVALKVRDGATRASEAAVLALLNHYLGFDLNTSYFSEKLSLRNWAKTTIGEIQVVLDPNVH